jgi:hypothetical protein
LVADVEAGVHDDASVICRLVVVRYRDTGARVGVFEVAEHLGEEPAEDGPEVLVPEPGGGADRLRDTQWLCVLDDDVLDVHGVVPFQCSELRFDPAQSRPFLTDGLFDLGLTHAQHAPELVERRLVVEDAADLIEGEAEIPQRQQPMQPTEWVR